MFLEDPPFDPRFVLVHVRQLPVESAFVADLRGGPQFRGWDPDRYIAAIQVDVMRALVYIYLLAHTGKNGRKPTAPEPYPLPEATATYGKYSKPLKPGGFAWMVAQAKKKHTE